jgi:PHD/YefM family antitoxin component YafN of YafNO toxin-antitoxin module
VNAETIGVKAAAENLTLLIDRVVGEGAEFVITRWRNPVAVLINVDELAGMREEIAQLGAEPGKAQRR